MCNYMMITDVYAREILDSRGNPTDLRCGTGADEAALAAGQQCPPALRLVSMKQSSFAMGRSVIMEKAWSRRAIL